MTVHVNSRERVMTALLTAKPGKQGELLQTLQSLVAQVRELPGSLSAVLGHGTEDPHLLILYLVWADMDALAGYLASDPFKILLGASSTLSVPAEFRFVADPTSVSAQVTNRVRGVEPPLGLANPDLASGGPGNASVASAG